MKPTDFSFLSCCCFVQFFSSVAPPASGKPVQTRSPELVHAAAGKDVILPCRLSTSVNPSRVVVVEWSRVDGPSPLTVHVLRDGEELEKEKSPEYLGRTAMMEDGSLKLLSVQRQDEGTYRCVLLRGSSVEDEVFVSLTVAEVSEVNLSVVRTSANQLFVRCESSGWRPEPKVSMLDSNRKPLAAQPESSVRPDSLYSVRAVVDVTAAGAALTRNGTLICRVEISVMSLAKENSIYITDEYSSSEAGHDWRHVLVFAIVLVCLVVVVFVVPVRTIEKLRRLPGSCFRWIRQQSKGQQDDQPLFGEYGDINRVKTTGASEETAKANNLDRMNTTDGGTQVSNKLAERDRTEMLKYRKNIISVGEILGVHPALIAAIISRQSQAGTKLNANGYGNTDPNCFGLMQINKNYHAVKGNPFSREHVDQGVTFFIQLIKTMKRTKPDWTKEQQLKGALACYIAGEDRVIPLTYDEVDNVTPYKDFANDVVARAQWFARNGFGIDR